MLLVMVVSSFSWLVMVCWVWCSLWWFCSIVNMLWDCLCMMIGSVISVFGKCFLWLLCMVMFSCLVFLVVVVVSVVLVCVWLVLKKCSSGCCCSLFFVLLSRVEVELLVCSICFLLLSVSMVFGWWLNSEWKCCLFVLSCWKVWLCLMVMVVSVVRLLMLVSLVGEGLCVLLW